MSDNIGSNKPTTRYLSVPLSNEGEKDSRDLRDVSCSNNAKHFNLEPFQRPYTSFEQLRSARKYVEPTSSPDLQAAHVLKKMIHQNVVENQTGGWTLPHISSATSVLSGTGATSMHQGQQHKQTDKRPQQAGDQTGKHFSSDTRDSGNRGIDGSYSLPVGAGSISEPQLQLTNPHCLLINYDGSGRPKIPDVDSDLRIFFNRTTAINQSMLFRSNYSTFAKMLGSRLELKREECLSATFNNKAENLIVLNVAQSMVDLQELQHESGRIHRFERMSLSTCPFVKPTGKCEILSLQHNRITKIDHLQTLQRLVFLDLSHNQLTGISGLDNLEVLRVLLLSKNHIKCIEGLSGLSNLEVLDLHQNNVRRIENLSHLQKLKLLNLAANKIVFVNGLTGMQSLTELNLRNNQIVQIEPMINMPNLLWIFLCSNQIERWAQLSGLVGLPSMLHVSLEGNPIVMDPVYRRLLPYTLGSMSNQLVKYTAQNQKKTPRTKLHPTILNRSCGHVACSITPDVVAKGNTDVLNATETNDVGGASCVDVKDVCSSNPKPLSCDPSKCSKRNRKDSVPGRSSNSNVTSLERQCGSKAVTKKDKAVMAQLSSSAPRFCKPSNLYIKWIIHDRTHLYITGCSKASDPDPSSTRTVLYPTLKMALSDLTCYRPTDRTMSGTSHPSKGSHLSQVYSLVVDKVKWHDLVQELENIRLLLPGLNNLKLVDVGLGEMTDILELVRIEKLESLCITAGSGNPIVKQAGQFWRPFVIWALRDTLGFKELDEQEVTIGERMKAGHLFKSVGQALFLCKHNYSKPIHNTVLRKENQETSIDHDATSSQKPRKIECILMEVDCDDPPETPTDKPRSRCLDAVETPSLSRTKHTTLYVSHLDQEDRTEIPRGLYLGEDLVKIWTDMLNLGKISTVRQQNVRRFVRKEVERTDQNLALRAQTVKIWPCVLEKLVDLLAPQNATNTL